MPGGTTNERFAAGEGGGVGDTTDVYADFSEFEATIET